MNRYLLAATVLLGSACNVSKAPSDLNNIQPWFWENYSSGTDSGIANAVVTLNGLPTLHSVTGTSSNNSFSGTLSTLLTSNDLKLVTLEETEDPSHAHGLLIVDEMNCTLKQLAPLLAQADQSSLHPGSYSSYTRTYPEASTLDDFNNGKTSTIAWETTYHEPTFNYTANVKGGMRLIPDQGSKVTPFGPILLAQTYMVKPATFGEGSGDAYFKQDYQMEVYYERTPGHVVHTFADWRDINVNFGGAYYSETNSLYQSIVLSNDLSWDADTAKHCSG